jgi:hypothetical protein
VVGGWVNDLLCGFVYYKGLALGVEVAAPVPKLQDGQSALQPTSKSGKASTCSTLNLFFKKTACVEMLSNMLE